MIWRISLLSILVTQACAEPSPAEVTPPTPAVLDVPPAENLVLVTIDTLRADFLETYGGPARTPALNALAARGWLFEDAISASMLTNPSHASIMTSLYPRDHGVYDNESGIADGMRTLASAMQSRGKRTGAIINFPHLNPEVSNLGQGFEHVVRGSRDERRAPEITNLALSLVDKLEAESQGNGFFVWIHYSDPHAPYDPPSTHPPRAHEPKTPIKRALDASPRFQRRNAWFAKAFREHEHSEELVAKYIAEIEAADRGLELLMQGLEARGLGDTAMVVTSDHGENMGEHDLYFHHGGLYRESVHVPLIVAAQGLKRRRFSESVATVDIAPTLLELAGAARWEPMRGHSLLDLARGEPSREYVFSEHMLAQLVSVRGPDGTLILHRKSSRQFPSYVFESGRREIYEPSDEHELNPVPPSGDVAHELEAAAQHYLGLGLKLSARQPVSQDRESLRALGYIE